MMIVAMQIALQVEVDFDLLFERELNDPDAPYRARRDENAIYGDESGYLVKRKYRLLEKGEIIQNGDEADASGWNDEPHWIPATRIGQPAPDPQYLAHTLYRRWIADWITE